MAALLKAFRVAGIVRMTTFVRTAAIVAFLGFLVQAPVSGQYYNNFGKNKVRYAKFDWRVYHAPHFDVWYYPEEEHLLEKESFLWLRVLTTASPRSSTSRSSSRRPSLFTRPTPIFCRTTSSSISSPRASALLRHRTSFGW